MTGKFTPKVVTANALMEGDVVYMKADNDWTRNLSEAELLTEEGYAKLKLLMAEGQPECVVGPYLADVVKGENGPKPVHFRESFRSSGPSNHFHGKQAELN